MSRAEPRRKMSRFSVTESGLRKLIIVNLLLNVPATRVEEAPDRHSPQKWVGTGGPSGGSLGPPVVGPAAKAGIGARRPSVMNQHKFSLPSIQFPSKLLSTAALL